MATAQVEQVASEKPAVDAPNSGVLLFGLTALLIATLLGPLMTGSDLPGLGESSVIRQISYVSIGLLTFIALRPWQDIRRLIPLPFSMILLFIWCWITVSWAIAPQIAMARLVLTSIVTWTIFSAVRYVPYERIMLVLRMVLLVFVVVNFAAVILAPEFAIHQANDLNEQSLIGDWRGIMNHKNLLAAFAAVTILVYTFDCDRFPLLFRATVVSISALLILLAGSKSAFGMVIGAIMIGLFFQRYRAKYRPLAFLIIGFLSVSAILIGYLYPNIWRIGLENPGDYTGQLMIWRVVYEYWLAHPLTGSGFGSFWGIGELSPVYHYGSSWVTKVYTSHNGYLSLLAEIGTPGLLLAIFSLAIWPLRHFMPPKAIQGPKSALLISLLFFALGHNMVETSMLDRDVFVNVILMLAIALIKWDGSPTTAVQRVPVTQTAAIA